MRTLYQTLMDSEMARLRVIALQWDVELVGQRRPDLAAELALRRGAGCIRVPATPAGNVALGDLRAPVGTYSHSRPRSFGARGALAEADLTGRSASSIQ
ncbi:MAG TPA: hypothetical protein G4N98_05125 [Thermoflexia bacterium]|nr:hypothetical protein [Thermoflexia bacterium]